MMARDSEVTLSPKEDPARIAAAITRYLSAEYFGNILSFRGSDQSPKKDEKEEDECNELVARSIDVAIIVAVPSEKDGVFSAFNLPRRSAKQLDLLDQYRIEYTLFEHHGINIALLIQNNMGMTLAASLTTRAILGLKPRLVAMVGICAGRVGKTNLGDLIIASNVFDYTAGKHYVDHFGPRPKSYPVDDTLSTYIVSSVLENHELIGQIIDAYQGDKNLPSLPTIHFKPMASGTAVVDDKNIIDEVTRTQDDLAGIDMEAYAVAVSANILRTKWLVIKTVQDFANGEKTATESTIRSYAAFSSAKLLELILPDLIKYV